MAYLLSMCSLIHTYVLASHLNHTVLYNALDEMIVNVIELTSDLSTPRR